MALTDLSNPTLALVSASLARLDDVPRATVANAVGVIVDTIGCMIGGLGTPEGAIVRRHLDMTAGAGPCTVAGRAEGCAIGDAAFANAVLAHVQELDDTHRTAIMHPAAPILPAAMAVAEKVGASGADFVRAVILGYEVGVRAAVAIQPSHWYKGYLSMGTCGAAGAAAAAGHLLGLDASKIAQAVGLAAIQAGGLNASIFARGDMGKLTTPASGAANGARAACLVASGMTGPETILEGRFGIFEVWADKHDVAAAFADIGEAFEIDRTGLKPYSCCRYIHGPLELLEGLMRRHALRAPDIETIEVRTYEAAVLKRPHRPEPVSLFDAKMSIPYCLAVLAQGGSFGEAEMAQGLGRLGELGPLASRVAVHADEGMTATFPDKWQSSVTVRDRAGNSHSAALDYPKGEPENPLSDPEVDAKFLMLAGSAHGEARARELLRTLRALPETADVRASFAALRAGAA